MCIKQAVAEWADVMEGCGKQHIELKLAGEIQIETWNGFIFLVRWVRGKKDNVLGCFQWLQDKLNQFPSFFIIQNCIYKAPLSFHILVLWAGHSKTLQLLPQKLKKQL